MNKLKTVIIIALVMLTAGCATTNTGEKKLSKKEQLEQSSREVKALQQQLVKEGNVTKTALGNLEKKLITANEKCDSLYNTPILRNAMAEGRLDLGKEFKEITIPNLSYELNPKLLQFPDELMQDKVSSSKTDKIAFLNQLKTNLQQALTEDRAKTKATVHAFEKELANRETLIKTLETTYAEEERLRKERERYGELIDKRDGKVYKTIKIGSQTWMAENLNVALFRNGDVIPEAKTKEEWATAGENGEPAWCYYENDPANGEKYGKLYNWFAVNDPRGLASEGWHVPSDREWTMLTYYLAGKDSTIRKKETTSGENYFRFSDESGFSSIERGLRYEYKFDTSDRNAGWWSSSMDEINCWHVGSEFYCYVALCRRVIMRSRDGQTKDGYVYRNSDFKGYGYSVRCIKDE